MKIALFLLIAGLVLLIACGVSLWSGKTIGLYGVVEPRTSIFYWIIVATYGLLGTMSLIFAARFALGWGS